jgi:hypothetical protein
MLSALLLSACSETGYVSTKSKAEETGQKENVNQEEKREEPIVITRSKPVKIK